jgi:hypothetical protein
LFTFRNKTRKIFHQEIVRGKEKDERLVVGDSAVFLSTSRPDRSVLTSKIHYY